MEPDLLILCATPQEISPFSGQYPAVGQSVTQTGIKLFDGHIGHVSYRLTVTGAGVFNTAHALTAVLEKICPQLILQTGIAGAFPGSGLDVGDVAVADQEQYIHTGVCDGTMEKIPLPFDLIKDSPETRQGGYQLDADLARVFYEHLCSSLKGGKTHVAKGGFITVSSITAGKSMADRIYKVYSPLMEAMEGAAAAHISRLYKIPFVQARSASNEVGERDKSKWDIKTAADRIVLICEAASRLIPAPGK